MMMLLGFAQYIENHPYNHFHTLTVAAVTTTFTDREEVTTVE